MYGAVDCLGFAGGFTLGMVQAGFQLLGKREMKGGFGVPSCEVNRHLLSGDWRAEIGDSTTWTIPDAQPAVVFGNPPCSGWSVMAPKKFRGGGSPALDCTWNFVRYVARVRPLIAVFESVQQAFTHADGLPTMRALRDYIETETGDAWTLHHVLHNAYSVGGAAQRRRYFWLVSRVPFGIEYPVLTTRPTLMDVWDDLKALNLQWGAQPYRSIAHEWTTQLLSSSGQVDGHMTLNSPLTRRMSDLMRDIDWKQGDNLSHTARAYYERFGRLPDSWRATEDKIIARDFKMGFTLPTRWREDQYARVITGSALQSVIHPRLNRTITHREAARVMGFPDDWLIEPLRDTSGLALTWGRGITVQCGRWIGEWIKRALDGDHGSVAGDAIGDREYSIDVTKSWVNRAPVSVLT